MNNISQPDTSYLEYVWKDNLIDYHSYPFFAAVIPQLNNYLYSNKCKGKLLDIGCGFGSKSLVFQKLGFDVFGVDNDQSRIDKATSLHPSIEFKCKQIEHTLPYADNSFDVVFSNSVFQYLHRDSILKECKRILKKDGHLILIENLKNNPITKIVRFLRKLSKFKYQSYPWNHFTYSEIIELKNEFNDSSTHVFHLTSPLAHIGFLKKVYPLFSFFDRKLLKFKLLKPLAWIVMFNGTNR